MKKEHFHLCASHDAPIPPPPGCSGQFPCSRPACRELDLKRQSAFCPSCFDYQATNHPFRPDTSHYGPRHAMNKWKPA